MIKYISASLLGASFLVTTAFAQAFNKAKADSFFDILAANNKAMESVALLKEGKVIYSRAIGFASVADNIKATSNTKYRIGSISKMFTAVMVFQLVEEGKLSLDDKLGKFYPQIPNAANITISNMLNHHSGIHNFTDDPDYHTWSTQHKTKSQMLEVMARGTSEFEPGSKGDYSNSNFVLLGYILEDICKKPYAALLQERIAKKIGLGNTYYGGTIDVKNNECYSYSFLGKWSLAPETDMSVPGGAGAVVSTPSDLCKFINALFAGKLIKEENLQQMKSLTDKYGMGMFRSPFGTQSAYGHTGGIDGFHSVVYYVPDENMAVACTANGDGFSLNETIIALMNNATGKPVTLPVFKTATVTAADLDKYIGTYSSKQMPLKVTISRESNTLLAQATGQPAFPLEPDGPDVFKFDKAGVVINFTPAKNEMTMKQGGASYLFTRE